MNDQQRRGRPDRRRQPGRSGSGNRSAGGRDGGRRGSAGRDGRGAASSRKPPPTRTAKPGQSLASSAGGTLPKWVRESVARLTPKARVAGALAALEEAATAFIKASYHRAFDRAQTAKSLSPREPSIRELLGLSAYRLGRWQVALQELRTYRRLAGDTTHLPVEMDVLRALDRPADVESGWATLRERGAGPAAMKEGRVVYGSFLLDQGEARKAWEITNPKKLKESPFEEDLRQWFVAARAAAALDDLTAARRLRDAIMTADPAFPGLEELDSVVGS